jgi:tyrosyl-tRNA synthetase
MDTGERTRLVERNLAEVVTEEDLESLLESDSPSAYIGYAPTGEMHIGHFATFRKLADFLAADVDVTVLIADLHAHLDDEKSPWDLLEARSEYYEAAIEAMVEAAGADADDVTFRRGREVELDPDYELSILRMAADTTISRAKRAGSEVVRQSDNPNLGGLLYTLMQAQDVVALDADIAYGGIDQRGIYMYAREVLPEWGHEKPVCLFAPLLAGLSGGKMSASEAESGIWLTDDRDAVHEKVGDAYCPAGEVEDNGVLEYLEYLVFPVLDLQSESFVVERPDEYGGDVVYDDYDDLEADFVEGELHPADLKPSAADAIADIVAPVRERILQEPDLLADAYPEKYGD